MILNLAIDHKETQLYQINVHFITNVFANEPSSAGIFWDFLEDFVILGQSVLLNERNIVCIVLLIMVYIFLFKWSLNEGMNYEHKFI